MKVAVKVKNNTEVNPKKNKPYQLDLFSDYVHETESEYFDQKLQVELRSMFPMNKSYNEDN